ncbi:hypothetical protein DO97_15645 [Neosynechococcus sphagnicola sy1]|uniref:Cytoskeleton protein RodZ-like C-terminal domain-containing protein n=1 Tax=Neosynechococcus sphagnicola sy1 TaxID=1497020 RepID=A0A098TI27_9CYAN|nr:hypothetical protein DO97_15645 [Neosynechococcus sphagnicola sy1]
MKVIVDGKSEFEGILNKGTQRTWQAQKELILRAGNAGAVMTSVNQGVEQPFGSLGEVKEITLSKNQVQIAPTN